MKLTWKDKTIAYILLLLIISIIVMLILSTKYAIDLGNILTGVSFLFLAISAILLYFQIRTGLSFNRRKAAFDFMMLNISKDLKLLFDELSKLAKVTDVHALYVAHPIKDFLDGKILPKDELPAFKSKIIEILNFYERMSIGIYTQVLDNSICYDDTGFNLIRFMKWVDPLIQQSQTQYDEERLFANLQDLFINWNAFYEKVKAENKKDTSRLTRKKIIRATRI